MANNEEFIKHISDELIKLADFNVKKYASEHDHTLLGDFDSGTITNLFKQIPVSKERDVICTNIEKIKICCSYTQTYTGIFYTALIVYHLSPYIQPTLFKVGGYDFNDLSHVVNPLVRSFVKAQLKERDDILTDELTGDLKGILDL